MQELVQIESPSEHDCQEPSIERWQVLEPISGRWSWMTVFGCCELVAVEPMAADEAEPIRRAA